MHQPELLCNYISGVWDILWCEPCVIVGAFIYVDRYTSRLNEMYARGPYQAVLCNINCCQ